MLPRLGVPEAAAALLASGRPAVGGWRRAYRRWRPADAGPLRLAETAAAADALGVPGCRRPSYDHYLLVVVPLLLAGLP